MLACAEAPNSSLTHVVTIILLRGLGECLVSVAGTVLWPNAAKTTGRLITADVQGIDNEPHVNGVCAISVVVERASTVCSILNFYDASKLDKAILVLN